MTNPYPPQGGSDPYKQPDPSQGGYAQPQYPQQAGYPAPGGQQPYGQPGYGEVDPATGKPLSDKSKMVAGLLGIFLGSFGVGRFYTGHTGMAIGQIAATWLTCGIGALWPIIDGIMILTKPSPEDAQGRVLRSN